MPAKETERVRSEEIQMELEPLAVVALRVCSILAFLGLGCLRHTCIKDMPCTPLQIFSAPPLLCGP